MLLDLWQIFDEHRDLEHPEVTLAHLLLGTAFSLWRAAFLIQKEPRKKITHDARDFLQVLLRDNAITYPQDFRTREWTGGYYLNSAHYRLSLAKRHLSLDDSQRITFKKVEDFIEHQQTQKGHVPNLDQGWLDACAATELAVSCLQAKLRSH